jgi:pimeloyl-ACP methyl ester carboxylesterase
MVDCRLKLSRPYTVAVFAGVLIFLATSLAALLVLLTVLVAREMVQPPRHTVGYALARGLPADPGDLGLKFEQWWLDRPDGARLPVWEVATSGRIDEGDEGDGGDQGDRTSSPPHPLTLPHRQAVPLTAVFVHGWGHSRIDMLALMTAWRGRCEQEVYYDLRGHGDAEGSRSFLGWREDDDLLALLERLGKRPFVLIGYSMGAVIALAAAAREHPLRDRIAGVFAYAPYADFHTSLRGRLVRAGQPTRPITDFALACYQLIGRPPRSLTEEDLRGIRCPVTLVHGEADIVSPPDQVRWMNEALPHAERIAMRSVGHELTLLSRGDEHDAAVESFLHRANLELKALHSVHTASSDGLS